MSCYLLLYVLQQERRGSQVVHGDVEESLNLFLMEVHGDQVCEACAHTHAHTHSFCQHQISHTFMSTPLRTRPRLCADVAPTAVVPTGFTHHGGHEFGDDGASLPHLALLAVREVGEDACDAPGTRGLAGVDHDQHLHDGGVDVPDEKSRRREGGFKTRSEAELTVETQIFCLYFLLTWTQSGSQRHLCLAPTPGSAPVSLWKRTECE